jgi:hypothetical protein
MNPPKSPLKRGTKIRILAPCLVRFYGRETRPTHIRFLRGFGGLKIYAATQTDLCVHGSPSENLEWILHAANQRQTISQRQQHPIDPRIVRNCLIEIGDRHPIGGRLPR